MAIEAALAAREKWAAMNWEQRAAIFLKAADLIAGPYRARLNAATMLGQSKNAYQAEIDSACEFIDFLRFNVKYMTDIVRSAARLVRRVYGTDWNTGPWKDLCLP